jgi:hypothetical protein
LFGSFGWKLKKAAIRAIARKFDDGFELNSQFVCDTLDLADVCIDFGWERQMRNLLLRVVLAGPTDRPKLGAVAAKYLDVFGDTQAHTIAQIISAYQVTAGSAVRCAISSGGAWRLLYAMPKK